jgi:hypothetical protein
MSANNIVPGVIKFKRGTVVPDNLQEGELFIKQVGSRRELYSHNGISTVPISKGSGFCMFSLAATPEEQYFNTSVELSIAFGDIYGDDGDLEIVIPSDATYTVIPRLINSNNVVSIPQFQITTTKVVIPITNLAAPHKLLLEILHIPHSIIV